VKTNNNALNDPGSCKFDFDLAASDESHAVGSLTDFIDIIGRAAYRRRIEDAIQPSSANSPEA
jgi:hypothetical protein